MKKTYMQPTLNVESAQPTNIICTSIHSDSGTGLTGGGGSSGEGHAPEWDVWGDDEE